MKKQSKRTEKTQRITIVFGYTLFILSLITLTISTIIPFGLYFFDPDVHHLNIAILLISLVAGAVLPPLASYFIGDRATHVKSKSEHHFNGVLFGIASYWLSLFFNFIESAMLPGIRSAVSEPWATVIAGWPILATLVIMVMVAIGYVKNRKKQPAVLGYVPYQLVLFAGLVATFVYILLHQYTATWVTSLLYVIVPVILVGGSYIILPAKQYSSSMVRLTVAVVAVSIGFIASTIAGQLMIYLTDNIAAPLGVGVVALGLYLLITRQK